MSVKRHKDKSELELGLLQTQVLWLLKNPTHGYELMKKLNVLKKTKITQGTLYPTLQRLDELELITSKMRGRKRVYHLTPDGKRVMRDSCLDFCKTFHGIFEDFVCEKCGVKR